MSFRPKIDEIDVKIMRALLKDPRISFCDIAKECDISSNSIRLRFERLKEEGVITGAITQVNPKSLGYNCIADIGIQTYAQEKVNILEFLKNIPGILWIFPNIGKYNIMSIVALPNVDDLAYTIEKIRCHPQVIAADAYIWVDVVRMARPENLVIEPSNQASHTTELVPRKCTPKPKLISLPVSKATENHHDKESMELDKTDLSIMKVLSQNARISFRRLADRLGISTQSVIRRYERLRKEVLPYSSITLDLSKIGFMGTVSILIKVTHKQKISDVLDKILQIPNVIAAFRVLGLADIMISIPFTTVEQLFILEQEIFQISGVVQTELLLRRPFHIWPLNVFDKLLPNQTQALEKR